MFVVPGARGKSERNGGLILASNVQPVSQRRRRNGSDIVSGDIGRQVVRDEPHADHHVLPGCNEEVPKGERESERERAHVDM